MGVLSTTRIISLNEPTKLTTIFTLETHAVTSKTTNNRCKWHGLAKVRTRKTSNKQKHKQRTRTPIIIPMYRTTENGLVGKGEDGGRVENNWRQRRTTQNDWIGQNHQKNTNWKKTEDQKNKKSKTQPRICSEYVCVKRGTSARQPYTPLWPDHFASNHVPLTTATTLPQFNLQIHGAVRVWQGPSTAKSTMQNLNTSCRDWSQHPTPITQPVTHLFSCDCMLDARLHVQTTNCVCVFANRWFRYLSRTPTERLHDTNWKHDYQPINGLTPTSGSDHHLDSKHTQE